MGNTVEYPVWEKNMERCEDEMLELSRIKSRITKSFTYIEMDQKPFRVRTFVVKPIIKESKTLVLLHGYVSSSVFFYKMLEPLARKYRIIMFENTSHGLNSRPTECSGMESPETAEAWHTEWIDKVINATPTLPEKFLMAGHSHGGFIASLYASKRPERIE